MSKISVSVIAVYLGEDCEISRICVNKNLLKAYKVIPIKLLTKRGEKIIIDRVLDIRRVASTKAGGLGDRYTCAVTLDNRQREIYIYKDEDDWYLEEEIPCADAT
jgi:hypothetical protein